MNDIFIDAQYYDTNDIKIQSKPTETELNCDEALMIIGFIKRIIQT